MYCCCCSPRNCSRRFYRLVVLCPNYPGHSFKTSKCRVPNSYYIHNISGYSIYTYTYIPRISPFTPSLSILEMCFSHIQLGMHKILPWMPHFLMVKKILCPSHIFSNPILICFHRFQCFQGPPRSRLPNTFDHTHHPRHLLPGKAQLDTRHGISMGKTVGKWLETSTPLAVLA